MVTTLAIIALFFIISTFYVLHDTISETLFEGKPMMPSEMKHFQTAIRTKAKTISFKPEKEEGRGSLYVVLFESALLVIFILVVIKFFEYMVSLIS